MENEGGAGTFYQALKKGYPLSKSDIKEAFTDGLSLNFWDILLLFLLVLTPGSLDGRWGKKPVKRPLLPRLWVMGLSIPSMKRPLHQPGSWII